MHYKDKPNCAKPYFWKQQWLIRYCNNLKAFNITLIMLSVFLQSRIAHCYYYVRVIINHILIGFFKFTKRFRHLQFYVNDLNGYTVNHTSSVYLPHRRRPKRMKEIEIPPAITVHACHWSGRAAARHTWLHSAWQRHVPYDLQSMPCSAGGRPPMTGTHYTTQSKLFTQCSPVKI